jgi:hypothetical protein
MFIYEYKTYKVVTYWCNYDINNQHTFYIKVIQVPIV